MQCKWINENLFHYVDRTLDPSQEIMIKEHLHGCSICSHELGKILNAWKMLDSWDDLEPPPHLQNRIISSMPHREIKRWFTIVIPAAAVLLIIIGISFIYQEADLKDYRRLTEENQAAPDLLHVDNKEVNEDDIIANLHLLREKDFFDTMDQLEKIDYLPLVEEQGNPHEKDQRSSLELSAA